MRTLTAILLVTAGLTPGCGGRTDSSPFETQPPPAEAPPPPVGVEPITAEDYAGIEQKIGAQYETLQKHVAARELRSRGRDAGQSVRAVCARPEECGRHARERGLAL